MSGCSTDPLFFSSTISSLPLIGGERPVPLRPSAGEVGGEAVEIVLAVFLERMMVALGTFQPDAEEQLADQRRDLVRLAAVAEQHGRPVVQRQPWAVTSSRTNWS